ncbi:hypothetical protein WR25_07634 isoform A [Diploscapter pachys]|uniref:Uncharacterized protein n=1 Tax=Diploscapter pachys TaxID=2018661 RepID=A0A2A2KY00_9BILA|nr:hypothetical protein WR25_07634 isoform A [Diploscapter pachys]
MSGADKEDDQSDLWARDGYPASHCVGGDGSAESCKRKIKADGFHYGSRTVIDKILKRPTQVHLEPNPSVAMRNLPTLSQHLPHACNTNLDDSKRAAFKTMIEVNLKEEVPLDTFNSGDPATDLQLPLSASMMQPHSRTPRNDSDADTDDDHGEIFYEGGSTNGKFRVKHAIKLKGCATPTRSALSIGLDEVTIGDGMSELSSVGDLGVEDLHLVSDSNHHDDEDSMSISSSASDTTLFAPDNTSIKWEIVNGHQEQQQRLQEEHSSTFPNQPIHLYDLRPANNNYGWASLNISFLLLGEKTTLETPNNRAPEEFINESLLAVPLERLQLQRPVSPSSDPFVLERHPRLDHHFNQMRIGRNALPLLFCSPPASPFRDDEPAILGVSYQPNGQPVSAFSQQDGFVPLYTPPFNMRSAVPPPPPPTNSSYLFSDFSGFPGNNLMAHRIALGPHSNADFLNYNIGILGLNKPLGCCFDAELQGGAWLIADSDNGRVVIISSMDITKYNGLENPAAICVVTPGKVSALLTDDSLGLIDHTAKTHDKFAFGLRGACRGLVVSASGNIITMDRFRAVLRIYNPDVLGDWYKAVSLTFHPQIFPKLPSFMVAHEDRIVISDLGRQMLMMLQVDDSNIEDVKCQLVNIHIQPILNGVYSPGGFAFVSGVQMDAHGNVLVCDAHGRTLQLFDSNLHFMYKLRLGIDMPYVSGFCVNYKGEVLFMGRYEFRKLFDSRS